MVSPAPRRVSARAASGPVRPGQRDDDGFHIAHRTFATAARTVMSEVSGPQRTRLIQFDKTRAARAEI